MKTVVITRPRADSEVLAPQLITLGYNTLIEPMLHIEQLDVRAMVQNALKKKPQAIIVTSRHALVAIPADAKEIPVIAVGNATASAAREKGFTNVTAADGNANALADYAAEYCKPDKVPLLYLRGEYVTLDLEAALKPRGLALHSIVAYSAAPAQSLSEAFLNAAEKQVLNMVMFFSQRSAETYISLVERAGIKSSHHSLDAICLSAKIADTLRALPWKNYRIAGQHDSNAMLECIAACKNL